MRQSRKKNRRQRAQKQGGNVVSGGNSNGESNNEETIIKCLVEAFSLSSIEEAEAAYKKANGDPNEAAEILRGLSDNSELNQTSCSSSTQSFGLDCSSSEGFNDSSNEKGCKGNRGKKLVASTGMVSNVLGKDYVLSSPKKKGMVKGKGCGGSNIDIEEAEQFLCSMLGDGCELSMGVVKDVLCNCGYDVEKALEVLLDLSSPCEQSRNDNYSGFSSRKGEDPRNIDCVDNFWQLRDRGSDSCSHSSESEIQDNEQLPDIPWRGYAEALVSSDSSSKLAAASLRSPVSELPQQVLESLFNIPKSSLREPATMNWRNVVKQMESFAQRRSGHCSSVSAGSEINNLAKGAEYHVLREDARQQWGRMRTCYQKAAAAYSNGERNYASYMSDQGKLYNKMAREADEKASMEIFKARNKDIENILTIDLHGQHVKPAMRLVKLHLLFGTYISSVQYLRIITGCGSNGVGKSKLKQSVINLLKKEGIQWKEENQGTIFIKLDGPREFSFLESGSDSDSG